MIKFSDDASVVFHLGDHHKQKEIQQAVKDVAHSGGITNTHLALKVNSVTYISR